MSTSYTDLNSELQPERSQSPSRQLTLARSRRLSQALKQAAVGSRSANSVVPAVLRPHVAWLLEPRRAPATRGYRFQVPVWPSFLVVVLLPSLIATIYFAFIASGQFTSEARFSVRSGEKVNVDLASGSAMTQGQDTLIVKDYLSSRGLVEELDKRIGLRGLFSRPEIDALSRFNPKAPIEELLRYWQQKASSTIDQTSGVVTIDVRAFTPEDAHLVARTVLELSEALVNDMSRRAREDLLAQSEAELHRAEARLKKARLAYQELRNEQGMLDPRKQAEGLGKMMSELRMERIRMQNELATTGQSLSPQAPQVQVLRARLAAADEQIAELQGKLTGNSASAEPSIATSITRFDNLETEHKVAQSQYGSAAGALERARMNAERQSLYLAAFVEPLVPQEARYPRRFWAILGFIVGASFLWGSGIGVATVIRDHMA
jgi:capsular polysaccharide transport system permease protein